MEGNSDRRLTSGVSTPRRFVYRSATQDDAVPHPLRRATDQRATDQHRAVAPLLGQPCVHAALLRFRVCLKLD